MEKPLINKQYLIEKMEGKGGWTYVTIPDIPSSYKSKLGLIRVRGFVDSYEYKQFNLLPMKNDCMLLPLKSAVRKKIGKKEGDMVHIILYTDDSPVVIPDDIKVCLMDSPKAHQFFMSLSESNQKYYIDWIEESKKLETKIERMAKTIERLENGTKFYDWPKKE
jgi:bifunctional DNA-binding transcriptional regulator/antitoxin component of YhaV-PrlF toxin-antitoxin module